MPGKPLFRSESEQARATAWLGRIVLIRPVSFAFLTACAFAMAAALGAYFMLGEYTRKARVTGMLVPTQGVVKILAQQAGLVEAVNAREGDEVVKDTTLIVIGDGRSNRRRDDIGAAVAARLAERRHALQRQSVHALAALGVERTSLERRRDGLHRELDQMDVEARTQEAKLANAGAGFARSHRLEEIGFLAPSALERERDALLEQRARAEALKRARLSLARDLATAELEIEAARARGAAQLAAIDAQRASVEQEGLERELQYRASIPAPAPGTVATILVEPGQMVVPGMPLATLLPADSTLEAHLFAPSRSIGFVRAGQDVLLRYLAYPHQKFGSQRAHVAAVSRNPMLPAELGFTPIDGTREPLYRIKVALASQSIAAYGHAEPLQAGMQVEADILLDRRRLIEWIFEPVLGLAGRA